MISFYKSLYYLGIVCAICANSPALADFYKYKDASDHIYLTDYPMGKSYKLISRIRTAPVRHRQLKNRKRQFSKLIAKIAKRYKLESALLHAMIRVESAYNPKAKSKVGAVGLMQLMPSTAKLVARKIVYTGFIIGISFTLFFTTNFSELISVRIAIGSGTAFIVSQLLDVQIFDKLREKEWFVAPLTSSFIGSVVDTFLFFSISFYGTGEAWVTLSVGDLSVKIFVTLLMLIPFRLLLSTFKTS